MWSPWELLEKNLFNDVNLELDDAVVQSHKLVLAGKSHYFYKMFQNSQQNHFKIPGYESSIFQEAILHMYDQEVNLTMNNVMKIHLLAREVNKNPTGISFVTNSILFFY